MMSPEKIARARQLIAELSAVLDELESDRAPIKVRRAPATPMPSVVPSGQAVDAVRRRLRRIGVKA